MLIELGSGYFTLQVASIKKGATAKTSLAFGNFESFDCPNIRLFQGVW
jgi:hypothetical protein